MQVSHSNLVHSCPEQPASQIKTSKSLFKGFFNKKSEKSPPVDRQRVSKDLSATEDPPSRTELYKEEGNCYFDPERHKIWLYRFARIKFDKKLEAFKQILEAADLFDCYILGISQLKHRTKPSLEMAKTIIQKFKVNPKFTLQVYSQKDLNFFKEVFAKEGYRGDQLLLTKEEDICDSVIYNCRFNHDFESAFQHRQPSLPSFSNLDMNSETASNSKAFNNG